MANIITALRIICAFGLLFCPVFSPVFYVLYLIAGLSDMIDGTIARKTNTVSAFGEKLDTVADLIFVVVCLIKYIPVITLPMWLFVWVGIIALIKIGNIIIGFVRLKQFVAVHSVMNKVTGAMLFILPLLMPVIDLKYSATVVCVAASIAAIQEGIIIGKTEMPQ